MHTRVLQLNLGHEQMLCPESHDPKVSKGQAALALASLVISWAAVWNGGPYTMIWGVPLLALQMVIRQRMARSYDGDPALLVPALVSSAVLTGDIWFAVMSPLAASAIKGASPSAKDRGYEAITGLVALGATWLAAEILPWRYPEEHILPAIVLHHVYAVVSWGTYGVYVIAARRLGSIKAFSLRSLWRRSSLSLLSAVLTGAPLCGMPVVAGIGTAIGLVGIWIAWRVGPELFDRNQWDCRLAMPWLNWIEHYADQYRLIYRPSQAAVLSVRIEGFTTGTLTCDAQAVIRQMESALPKGALMGRVRGDYFVIFVPGPESRRIMYLTSCLQADLLSHAKTTHTKLVYGVVHLDKRLSFQQAYRLAELRMWTRSSYWAIRERERRAQVERLAAIGRTGANLAHELRSSLAALRTFTRLQPSAKGQWGPLMEREIERTMRVIDTVMALAQDRKPILKPVEIEEIIETIYRVCLPLTEELTGSVSAMDMTDQIDYRIHTDIYLLGQVIENLVRNALESAPGTQVEICLSKGAGCLVLTVVNNGPPIYSQTALRLFQPFWTTKTGGTGLGLALVSTYVEKLQGTIALTSRSPVCFEISLPDQ